MRVRTPTPDGRVPPVLDVALLELPCGGAQDLRSRFLRGTVDQRHHVLKLVAEPVRSAGLIEGGTRPHPARQHLIHEPPVEHQVDGRIGRRDLQRVQVAVPVLLHLRQQLARRDAMACTRRSSRRTSSSVVRLTEGKDDSLVSPGKNVSSVRDGGARIEARARGPDSLTRLIPAGAEVEPCRQGTPAVGGDRLRRRTAATKAISRRTRPAQAFRASIASLSASRSQTTCSGAFSRAVPRTHST